MHSFKKSIIVALAVLASATTAFASTIQNASSAGSYDSNWSSSQLGSVIFEKGTNLISALTSTVTIQDQGWGGEDENNNQVVLGLFDNDQQLWATHVAGGTHNMRTESYDISKNPASLASLNSALSNIDWTSGPSVAMKMYTSTIGYPGWSLTTQNNSFAVTSNVVPEPESCAMLLTGLGLMGFMMRRKSKKTT